MQIALCVGHTPSSPGALNGAGLPEYVFNGLVVQLVKAQCPEIDIYNREYGGTLHMLRGMNRKMYDLVMDLHFNGCSDPNVQRAEVLYFPSVQRAEVLYFPGNTRTEKLATKICQAWVPEYQSDARVLARDIAWTGKPLLFLTGTRADALILEPFFGRGADWEKFTAEYVAQMVCAAIEAVQK